MLAPHENVGEIRSDFYCNSTGNVKFESLLLRVPLMIIDSAGLEEEDLGYKKKRGRSRDWVLVQQAGPISVEEPVVSLVARLVPAVPRAFLSE